MKASEQDSPSSRSASSARRISGAAACSCPAEACLKTQTANSMPACLSLTVVPGPYTHSKIACREGAVDQARLECRSAELDPCLQLHASTCESSATPLLIGTCLMWDAISLPVEHTKSCVHGPNCADVWGGIGAVGNLPNLPGDIPELCLQRACVCSFNDARDKAALNISM